MAHLSQSLEYALNLCDFIDDISIVQDISSELNLIFFRIQLVFIKVHIFIIYRLNVVSHDIKKDTKID